MSMFVRLFLLLGLVSVASLSVVSLLLWRSSVDLERNLHAVNSAVGRRALDKGAGLLESDLQATHLKIVREKAKRLEAFFADIGTAVHLESALIRQSLSDAGDVTEAPPIFSDDEIARREKADPTFTYGYLGVKPYVMFHLAPGVTRASMDNQVNRLRRMGGYFAHTLHALAGCYSVHYGGRDGYILGYPGRTAFDPKYDPRRRNWYYDTITRGALHWATYADRDESLIMTCAYPVTPAGGREPVGVAAIDVVLRDVLDELFDVGSLKVTRAILMDDRQRVLVSASFDGGKVAFDKKTLLRMPPVGELGYQGFTRAVEQIGTDSRQDVGIFHDGPDVAHSAHLYIYSSVRLKTLDDAGDAAASPGLEWHYVVELPTESLVQPLLAVTGEIGGATHDISDAIAAQTRKSTATLLGIIAATLLAALTVAYFAARATSRPLMQMAGVARAVGGGDLDQKAVETSGGEVGELGRAVNAMIRGLRQRDLLKHTFGRYVAPSVVDQVLLKGNASLGGVNRVLTVFFSDLKGFTTLSETTDPQTLVCVLNEYFDAMTKVILDTEGTLDKYIGDAILAFWGDPVVHEDDAARACRAALAQYRELRRLCESWDRRGLPRLDMRVGIQTGEAIVGNVGSELKLNYTVLGDTVNFASRLEGVNKQYGTHVLIGESTRRAAGAAIEVREVDFLTVVGKTEPVRVYELIGLPGEVSAAQRAAYDQYEAALSAYWRRQWDEAEAHGRAAQTALGGDGPSATLLTRIAACRKTPPPPDWNGVAVLLNK